ncbi:hypothetical protein [Noviherbaspirillum aridicola]|uniref:Glycine zipper domain-containing protein n=1 Tax=Noviherbaspirillum aridicola TaxID=2849687 RepID=A0ABQ4Q3T6_9BURK|nr:hypothetical protein [Noviherbaspirillum aridicola]GIZ51707.1 hypothetical protein NCCP691_17210 [Noviherbaspirillum aridicola]
MTTIIAGRFQEQAEAQGTIEELLRAGFAREHVSTFYCNPPGQHGTYALGGDADKSQGAKESDKGVAKGAAAGAAVGLAAAPVLGPIGAVTGGLVGAHIGGTMGAMSEMKERGETSEEDQANAVGERRAGMMVAVRVSDQDFEDRAVNVLRSLGAADIERAEGTIENGDWVDFDPLAPPTLVQHARAGHPGQAPQRRL